MAQILEFRVTGLAGRRAPLSQELNPDVNVFFGANGSGKTSLLRILHSALSGDTSFLSQVPFSTAEVKVKSFDYKKVYTRFIERPRNFSEVAPSREVILSSTGHVISQHQKEPPLVWQTDPKPPKDFSGWGDAYLPTSRLYVGGDLANRSYYNASWADTRMTSEGELDKIFAQSIQRLWSEYSVRTSSVVRKAQAEGLANIVKVVLSGKPAKKTTRKLSGAIAHERVRAFLARQGPVEGQLNSRTFAKRYAEDAQIRSVVADIDKVEQRIEKATKPRNDLEHLIRRMYGGNKEIRFLETSIEVISKTGRRIGLEALSSGEKHVLRLFLEVLRRPSTSCIYIDEPEISLHIDWQRILIGSMQQFNPHLQYVIATHSPEIMAEVSDSKIFRI